MPFFYPGKVQALTSSVGALRGAIGLVPNPTGNQATDQATAQAVIDSVNAGGGGEVRFPAGTWNGHWTLYPKIAVRGAGMDATVFGPTDPEQFVFTYKSPLDPPAMESYAPSFAKLTISAKNAIDLNQSGDFATIFQPQNFLFGLHLAGVRLLGTYTTATDANRDTAVVPTQASLDAFGVGLRAAKCFNLHIDKTSIISGFGVGARLDGCDRATVQNRFIGNARHIANLGHDTFGNELSTPNAEFLVNRRAGAILVQNSGSENLSDAYYECYTPAALYWIVTNTANTRIKNNRVTDPGGATPIRIALLEPNVGMEVAHNIYEGGTTLRGFVEMTAANYAGNGTLVRNWTNNGAMSTPNIAQMATTLTAATTLTLPDSDKDFYFVSGTTTIDNLGPSYPGRTVTLAPINGFTMRHFAASAGNLRLKSGADTPVGAAENITFINYGNAYGNAWVQQR